MPKNQLDPCDDTGTHPTDRKILDAFDALTVKGVRVTDPKLAEISGVSRRTVKKRRLRMIHAARWPGRPRQGPSPPEVVARLGELAKCSPRPTYAIMAELIESEFGRPINPKTVERILGRPNAEWLKAVADAIRAEALREYATRHDPDPYTGRPAWQVMRMVPGCPAPRTVRREPAKVSEVQPLRYLGPADDMETHAEMANGCRGEEGRTIPGGRFKRDRSNYSAIGYPLLKR